MHSLSVHWENSACILCITVKPLLLEGIAVTMVTVILLIFFHFCIKNTTYVFAH